MKTNHPILFAVFTAIILLSACKKETNNKQKEENTPPIVLLKSNQWKVMASESILKIEGILGGSIGTVAFNTQKTGELRWYTMHSTKSNFSGQNEIILYSDGKVTKENLENSLGHGGQIKTIYGSDIWKINLSPDNMYQISNAYKNNQNININKESSRIPNWKNLQASEDGLLTSTKTSGSNSIGHFHYGTQQWKHNTYYGNNTVAIRYNGLTYAVSLLKNMDTKGISIYVETDSMIKKPDSQIPSLFTIYYPMKELKLIDIGSIPGFIMHATLYNDNLFIVTDNYQSSNTQYSVYKINLTQLSASLIQAPTWNKPFGLGISDILYNQTMIEVDDEGNLYVVEVRTENQKPSYSIRKYLAKGGSEIILKEDEIIQYTHIQAIKYFNGKLHAAISYKEKMPEDNTYTYHLQIIAMK
ncbi:MAG: hypothetical protein LC105_01865 [Chitinophagales bacterium]|nr:hypothetical protein [Chitinophagales bacterium]MCZ2392592.1 hypothetical protein [Chitinophagales bacterium]